MKATGIVRRIDDLGRVVIPKEIRRTMRIRDGDPLEIYTEADGGVVFRKYSPIGELAVLADRYAAVLHEECGRGAVICDRDRVIAAAGLPKKGIVGKGVSPALEQAMDSRRAYYADRDGKPFLPLLDSDAVALAAVPIVAAGDISGAVLLIRSQSGGSAPSEAEIKLCRAAAGFLSNQLED